MLYATYLHAAAAEYRANAEKMTDARTREQFLEVANCLEQWAADAEAKHPASKTKTVRLFKAA